MFFLSFLFFSAGILIFLITFFHFSVFVICPFAWSHAWNWTSKFTIRIQLKSILNHCCNVTHAHKHIRTNYLLQSKLDTNSFNRRNAYGSCIFTWFLVRHCPRSSTDLLWYVGEIQREIEKKTRRNNNECVISYPDTGVVEYLLGKANKIRYILQMVCCVDQGNFNELSPTPPTLCFSFYYIPFTQSLTLSLTCTDYVCEMQKSSSPS